MNRCNPPRIPDDELARIARRELRRVLKRRGQNVNDLYKPDPNAYKLPVPVREVMKAGRPTRKAACGGCGKKMTTRMPVGVEPKCMGCEPFGARQPRTGSPKGRVYRPRKRKEKAE